MISRPEHYEAGAGDYAKLPGRADPQLWHDHRLDLLRGTLDVLILGTLQSRPQHGHGIGPSDG